MVPRCSNIYSNFNNQLVHTVWIQSSNGATLYRTVVRDTTTPQFVYPANDVYPAVYKCEMFKYTINNCYCNGGNNKYVFDGEVHMTVPKTGLYGW